MPKKTDFAPDWNAWDRLIETNGITIDRPIGSRHPELEDIVYPIDYGFVNGTLSSDGEELDIFVGASQNGLVAVVLTEDHRKHDRECKLLYNCSWLEVYLVNGFINFDPSLMQGRLVLRNRMDDLR